METLTVEPVSEGKPLGTPSSSAVGKKRKWNTVDELPPSKRPLDRDAYSEFQAQPLEKKRDILKAKWLGIGYLLLGKADLLAQSLSKKDYGRMVQLLTSSGICWDKVFPKDIPSSQNNLILNLFNGLPKERLVRVIGEVPLPKDEPLPTATKE